MNKITDVFFDLDHTLWDFDKNSEITYDIIFEKNNIDVDLGTFLEAYKPINLSLWKSYREERISKEELRFSRLKKTFNAVDFDASDNLINLVASDYIKYLSKQVHLIDGAKEILNYLKPNYKLHIITNGFQEVQQHKLKNTELDSYFEVVVNSEMAGVKKPHPAIFEFALNKAQVNPEQSIMIGDSIEADIEGAQNMNIQTILFNYHQETVLDKKIKVVNSLSEIKKYL